MAFFGLTALGPQNCFEYATRNSCHIFIFEPRDFEVAWRRVLGDSTSASDEEISRVFKILYRGPVPVTDKELIARGFAHLQAPYGFDDYMDTMTYLARIKDEEQHRVRLGPGPACDFNESSELQSAMRKNKATERKLQDKLALTLTNNQEVNNMI
jgi:hypothetical protein